MKMLLLCGLVAAVSASGWNYDKYGAHGPSHWPDRCVEEDSKRQSPINIETGCVTVKCAGYDDFSLEGYDSVSGEFNNNGHSVQLTLDPNENAILRGGGLKGTYRLAQLHFHWGSEDWKGSEHTIDGKPYPMEVHFVHYNTKYGSMGDADEERDGLAVLAWLFEISDTNEGYKQVFDELQHIQHPDDQPLKLQGVNLLELMGCTDPECVYFRYQGSLTTPPCYQSVTWTVFEETLEISSAQMDQIRSVLRSSNSNVRDERMYNNFRPIQPRNGRKVYVNDETF